VKTKLINYYKTEDSRAGAVVVVVFVAAVVGLVTDRLDSINMNMQQQQQQQQHALGGFNARARHTSNNNKRQQQHW